MRIHRFRISFRVDYRKAMGVIFRNAPKCSRYSAMVVRIAAANGIRTVAIACCKPRCNLIFTSFEQNRQVRAQSATADGVDRTDRLVAQRPRPALVGATRVDETV